MNFLSHSTTSPIESLADQGWWLGNTLFSPDLLDDLTAEARERAEQQLLTKASIGRGQDKQLNAEIRGDGIQWIDPDCDTHTAFFSACEKLCLDLNRQLFLGVNTVEAHYAHYPAGAFYQRHVDSFKGAKNRLVSMVVYLNPDWQPSDAGELELWSASGESLGYVAPKMGDVLLMLSEEMPHQVLPTTVDRYSIAAWFRQ